MQRRIILVAVFIIIAGITVWRVMHSGRHQTSARTRETNAPVTTMPASAINIRPDDLLSLPGARMDDADERNVTVVSTGAASAQAVRSPVFIAYLDPGSMLSTGKVETTPDAPVRQDMNMMMAVLGVAPSPSLQEQYIKTADALAAHTAVESSATPTRPAILDLLADPFLHRGKSTPLAEGFYPDIVRDELAKALYLVREGDARLEDGSVALALAAYREAIDLFPDMMYANQQAGRMCMMLGRYDNATRYLLVALNTADDITGIMNDLGISYLNAGNAQKAEELFRAAMKSDPRSIVPAFNLGFTLRRFNRNAEARAQFEKCLLIDPSDARPLRELAMLDVAEGQRDSALVRLEQATKLNPGWSQPTFDASLLLAGNGQFDDAAELLLRAAGHAPVSEVLSVYQLPVFNTFRLSPSGRAFEGRLAEIAREQARPPETGTATAD